MIMPPFLVVRDTCGGYAVQLVGGGGGGGGGGGVGGVGGVGLGTVFCVIHEM